MQNRVFLHQQCKSIRYPKMQNPRLVNTVRRMVPVWAPSYTCFGSYGRELMQPLHVKHSSVQGFEVSTVGWRNLCRIHGVLHRGVYKGLWGLRLCDWVTSWHGLGLYAAKIQAV